MGALDADIFLIEYSERITDLAAFRDVPKGKVISLGIINTRDPRVEIAGRDQAPGRRRRPFHSVENLSICPNCGFSGAAVETWVTEDIEKRKLAVLVETAEQIWG